jgi:bifunctional non-homologous end joining protein LigD
MAAKFEEYNRKRDFEKTGEPEGKTEKPEKRLKFVVQHHIARRDHFDLRLEWDGVLLSWAVPRGPSYNTRDRRLAVQVEDHPLEYRNFEGIIPRGEYGGGVVMLWDEGYWEPQTDVDEGLSEGSLKFVLKGRRLKGKWTLIRMKAKAGEAMNNWLLIKEKDDYAKTADGISGFTVSVRTGRTMAEIEEGADEKITRNPFSKAAVQLAKLVNTVPEGEDWLYELKYDGHRILAYLEGNNAQLITRNGNDDTNRFQDIADSLIDWAAGRAMVLDGEMVITDAEGKTDFQALQSYMRNPEGKNLTYIVFDLLALDGVDLRGHRLIDRKETLEALMKASPENLYYSQHIRGKGKESLLAACKADLKGIVGKKADSVYSGTRNGDWIKLKCDQGRNSLLEDIHAVR